eukprot:8180874-Pyramimonas_sp.AAC.1
MAPGSRLVGGRRSFVGPRWARSREETAVLDTRHWGRRKWPAELCGPRVAEIETPEVPGARRRKPSLPRVVEGVTAGGSVQSRLP